MNFARVVAFATAVIVAGAGHVFANEVRFSSTLEAAERTASGLTKLNSDQVAVIDALVRRDTATRGSSSTSTTTAAAATSSGSSSEKTAVTFSRRLTVDERKPAGLAALSPAEVAQLDALVDRYQNAKLARTLLAPPSYITRSRVNPTETKKERQIHGSYSLSFGWGSGGYSEKTGSMLLNFEDPEKGYSVTIGYSESHIKGGPQIYRDPMYRDPFYDTHREYSLGVGVTRP